MAAPRDPADDGWEDLANDCLSVISLSDSEHDAVHEPEQAMVEAETTSDLASDKKTEVADGVIRGDPPSYEHINKVIDRAEGIVAPSKPPSDTKSRDTSPDSIDAVDLEPARDPPLGRAMEFRKSILTLLSDLDETTRVVGEACVLGDGLTGPSLNICNQLQQHARKLQHIACKLIKSALSGGSRGPYPPLDPDLDTHLGDWVSTALVKVLRLRAETRRLAREPEPHQDDKTGPMKGSWHVHVFGKRSNLEQIWDELVECNNMMDRFMPLLKEYLRDYQPSASQPDGDDPTSSPTDLEKSANTRSIVKRRWHRCKGLSATVTRRWEHPDDETTTSAQPSRQPCQPPAAVSATVPIDIPARPSLASSTSSQTPSVAQNPNGPGNYLWLLRRDLYSLKDSVAAVVTRLDHAYVDESGQVVVHELTSGLARRYRQLNLSLGAVLSRTEANWLAVSPSGGLNRQQFLALKDAPIRLYATQLTEAVSPLRPTTGLGRVAIPPYHVSLGADALKVLQDMLGVFEATLHVNTEAEGSYS